MHFIDIAFPIMNDGPAGSFTAGPERVIKILSSAKSPWARGHQPHTLIAEVVPQ